jgi:hypothetical protein
MCARLNIYVSNLCVWSTVLWALRMLCLRHESATWGKHFPMASCDLHTPWVWLGIFFAAITKVLIRIMAVPSKANWICPRDFISHTHLESRRSHGVLTTARGKYVCWMIGILQQCSRWVGTISLNLFLPVLFELSVLVSDEKILGLTWKC